MSKTTKVNLSETAINQLKKELQGTTSYSLSGEIHKDIKDVLDNMNTEKIEKLFDKHDKVLICLQVTTLIELHKI